MGIRSSRLGNVYSFSLFDLLTSLGSKLSVRSFKLLIAWGLPFIAVVFTLAILALMRFMRILLAEEAGLVNRDWLSLVAFGITVTLVYLGVSCLVSEVLTRRRFCVAANPNIGLFRSLDIRMIDVFLVVAGARIALVHVALYIPALTFVFTFLDELESSPSLSVLLVLVPTCSLVVVLSVAARNAIAADVLRGIGPAIQVALIFIFAVLGWATSVFGAHWTALNLPRFSTDSLEVGARIAVSLLGLAAIVCLVDFGRCLSLIRKNSFPILPQYFPPPRERPGESMLHRLSRPTLFLALYREFRGANAASIYGRSWVLLTLALAWAGGMRFHGGILPLTGPALASLAPILFLGFYLLALAQVDATLAACGPTTLKGQLRTAWENGRSAVSLAAEAQTFYNIPLILLAAGAASIDALLFGRLSFGYAVIAVSAVSAALIAESLTSAPKELSDGSVAPNLFVGLMTILLSVPALALVVLLKDGLMYVGLFYCFILWGGASLCMVNRIKRLPLMLSM